MRGPASRGVEDPMKQVVVAMIAVLGLAVPLLGAAGGAPGDRLPRELWIVDGERLPPSEQALLATLQGVLNEKEATVWVRTGGMSAVVLEELRGEGVPLREA